MRKTEVLPKTIVFGRTNKECVIQPTAVKLLDKVAATVLSVADFSWRHTLSVAALI